MTLTVAVVVVEYCDSQETRTARAMLQRLAFVTAAAAAAAAATRVPLVNLAPRAAHSTDARDESFSGRSSCLLLLLLLPLLL